MRIQHNIPAMNSYRNYSNNVSKVSKNLEKLSTGYKINRAGDDAAGLAISEKMRIQITGLEKAQDNAKAGINLVQTAEGALTEVHDMLNRMFDLAEQSANGTFDDTTDRNQLQKEVQQLRDEIDRIADATNYNGIQLLDGSMEKKTVSAAVQDIGATADDGVNALNSFTRIQDGDPGQSAQAGVFSLDLSNFEISAKNDGQHLMVNIFGKDLDLGARSAGPISGEDMVATIAKAWNDTYGSEEIGTAGVTISAKVSLDEKKVEFSMNNPPEDTWDVGSNVTFGVGKPNDKDPTKYEIDKDLKFEDHFSTNNANGVQLGTKVPPVATNHPRTYAQASFDLSGMVANGRTLQIGDETYVFAVGRNSQYTDMKNVIDLTDFEEADFAVGSANEQNNLTVAAMRLTKAAANNSMFKVSSHTADESVAVAGSTIYLTEREGAIDYTVNDLKGQDNSKQATDKDGNGLTDKDGNAILLKDGNWTGLVKTGIVDNAKSTDGLTLQIGDTAEKFNQLNISVKDLHSSALGLSDINIGEQGGAQKAMDLIKAATNYVSDVRGGLGALQNRLDHTINNLSVAQENIQDAESTIRDVDVAKEMMAYTKNNILVQSAQAMLAQANQLPQGVLQLLG